MKILKAHLFILALSLLLLVCCKSRKTGTTTPTAPAQTADRQLADISETLAGNTVQQTGDGIRITFASEVLFANNSSILTDKAKESVRKLAEAIQKLGYKPSVKIEGHTDNTGTPEYNKWLSERRGNAVKAYLEQLGVKSPVEVAGLGDSKPVADNKTEEGRAKNRRVEVMLSKQQ